MTQSIKNYLIIGVLGTWCAMETANAEVSVLATCDMVAECAPGCSWDQNQCACTGTPTDTSRGEDCNKIFDRM